jgi:hypothetical protein
MRIFGIDLTFFVVLKAPQRVPQANVTVESDELEDDIEASAFSFTNLPAPLNRYANGDHGSFKRRYQHRNLSL